MANNTTSLYISDSGIRLMVTRGRRITKLADMPLDVNLSEIDDEKEAELVNKIKLLFKSNHIGVRKIILGISGLHCLTRPVSLPELPKTMIEEAITREAKRVLPVPIDQLYISWQITSSGDGKIQVFVVAIPKVLADNLVRILNKTGFKPYLMDIKPLALARVSREANAILIDMQPEEFDIVILSKGIPQTVRTVPFPQEYMDKTDRLTIVRDELKRTIQFYNSNNPQDFIQPDSILLVSGELVDEAETMEFLTQELGYKVSLLVSPLKCLKQLDPSHHLMNVGLALKEMPRDAGPLLANINALPSPFQPKQIPKDRLMALPAAAVAVGLVVLLFFTVQNAAAKIEKDQNELDLTRLQIEKKTKQKKELVENVAAAEEELSFIIADREKYSAALENLSAGSAHVNGDLEASVNNPVTGMDLRRINHGGTTMSINGEAPTEQEVMQFVRKLQDTGRFEEITITSISLVEGSENVSDVTDYTLSLRLEKD